MSILLGGERKLEMKPLTELLTKEELYKLYSEGIQEIEQLREKIEKLNRVVSILSRRNEKYYQLKSLLQGILSEDN